MKKTLIYSDKEFSDKTKIEIEEARQAAQELLDTWNSLKLPAFTSLFELIHNPQGVYERAGQGNLLPNILYVAARTARNHIIIGNPDLISVKDNKTVVINEVEAERLVSVNNVYAENETQAKFCRDVVQYVELSNSISQTLMALPTTRMPAEPFSRTGRFFPNICTLKLETEYLQEILKAM